MKALVTLLFIALAPAMAWAHSQAQETSPADGAVLAKMPGEIALTFTDKLRLTKLEVHHSDGVTQELDLSSFKAFATEFALPLDAMGAGDYEVEWRGLGIDGHAMKGTFSFEVE